MKYFIILLMIFSFDVFAEENKQGFSTLPGWSAGYRYYLDMDDSNDDKIRLFGKYKQTSGSTVKFGADIKYRDSSQNGVLFFEQEFKF